MFLKFPFLVLALALLSHPPPKAVRITDIYFARNLNKRQKKHLWILEIIICNESLH
ncbi:hypothetical protein ACJW31_04G026500 [Castanea mollissima]